MKIEIHAKPIFWMELSLDQIKVLMKCSKSHYDGTCQNACERGGFLFGWNNWIEFSDTNGNEAPPKVSGDFGQLDLCLKILEMDMLLSKEEKVTASQIRTAFNLALMTSNIEVSKILVTLE